MQVCAIIREICSRPVEQGRGELIVCVSEKSFPIVAYRALDLRCQGRSRVCVFVWACLRTDLVQGLGLAQREGAPKAFEVDWRCKAKHSIYSISASRLILARSDHLQSGHI